MSELTQVQRVRQEMPAATAHLYLNTGTFGPLPTCVTHAMQERMQKEWSEGRLGAQFFEGLSEIYGNARRGVARLLHATEDEIALTDNTGEGMNVISYGFNWQAGDEVVTTNHEHFSALAPLYQIRDRFGIVVREADLGERADLPLLTAISEQVTERTRLIVISHVTWSTGTLLDIASVGRMGRERGIPVLVDGAQSAGAVPINVKELDVDFYAIPMQKWLCGPDGTGALYVRKEALPYVTSTYVGYWSAKHEENREWALNDNAQRFELGGRQTAALAGQSAVLDWLDQFVGFDWLYSRISDLHSYAWHELQKVPGLNMITPRPGATGLLSFTLKDKAEEEVVKTLNEQHNINIRSISSLHALRVSTGFYNTREEIDTLAQTLARL